MQIEIQNHRPLREIVYEELKMQIMTGKIEPGTRMMEVELAEDMGVSRTPVREAIRKLEKEGLVVIEPRRGAYASQLTKKDMLDILLVREAMEGLAAYLAVQNISEEQKKRIVEVAKAYDEALANGDTAALVDNDTEFHTILVEASGNRILLSMIEQLQEYVIRFRYLYYDDYKRAEKISEEHKIIAKAIVSGDADGAKKAASLHIERMKEMVLADEV